MLMLRLNPQRYGGDVWFDTVAVLLAMPDMANKWLNFETLNVQVTADGHTVVSPNAPKLSVATTWKSGGQAAFELYEAQAIAAH